MNVSTKQFIIALSVILIALSIIFSMSIVMGFIVWIITIPGICKLYQEWNDNKMSK
jgi:uncharacterized protein HemY